MRRMTARRLTGRAPTVGYAARFSRRHYHVSAVDLTAMARTTAASPRRSSSLDANEKFATDYPAAVAPHMTNTDSTPFMDFVPSISLRENERGMHTGAGWNPTWHQPLDVFSFFSDKDFRLGLNAAQTTLGGVGELAGARLKK